MLFFPQMVLTAFSQVGMLREAWPPSAWRKTPWGTSTTTCRTSMLYRWRAWGSGRCSSWVGSFPPEKAPLWFWFGSDFVDVRRVRGLCPPASPHVSSGQTEAPQHEHETRRLSPLSVVLLYVSNSSSCFSVLHYSSNDVVLLLNYSKLPVHKLAFVIRLLTRFTHCPSAFISFRSVLYLHVCLVVQMQTVRAEETHNNNSKNTKMSSCHSSGAK